MAELKCGWGPAKEWRNGKGQGVPSADGQAPALLDNHAKKKRPPRCNEKNFRDYYDVQLAMLTEEDRESMYKCLNEPLPVTFRLVGPLQKGSKRDDADRYNMQLCDLLARAEESGTDAPNLKSDKIQRLEWYPHEAAWKLSIGKKDMKKVANLQNFLLQETSAGSLVRMEAVSMIPALVLAAVPGDFVLDMCAAPGSKTGMCLEMVMHSSSLSGHLSQGEASMGAVLANDPDINRSKMMVHRTKALCSPSLVVTALPGQTFPQLMSEDGHAIMFDRVLCDVPCSGDGTLRKAPYNLKTWHVTHSLQFHLLQTLLLQRSIELTKVGGYIVYSTCSLNPLENEAVIAHVVGQAINGELEICECPQSLASLKWRRGLLHWRVPDGNFPGKFYDSFDEVVPARTARGQARQAFSRRGLIRSMFCSSKPDGTIKEVVNGQPGLPHLSTRALGIEKCMRILPHDNDTGAFFVTLLRKNAHVSFAAPLDPEAANDAAAATAAALAPQPQLADKPPPCCTSGSSSLSSHVTEHTTSPDAAASGKRERHLAKIKEEMARVGIAEGEGETRTELPKEFVDHCTRLTKMEQRVQKLVPYVPLLRMPHSDSICNSLSEFYGISPSFPFSQLLAHNEGLKTIHYVTAAARRALDASPQAPEPCGQQREEREKRLGLEASHEEGEEKQQEQQEVLNVVVAGTKMFEKDDCADCGCRYRVCMDGIPFLLPFLSQKRVVRLGRAIVEELLQTRVALLADCPCHLQEMEVGSCIGVCEVSSSPLSLWKGKTRVKLFVSGDDAGSILGRLRTFS